MYRRLISGFLFCMTVSAPELIYAQYQENALKFSEVHVTGTARIQGLGGGHAALGGDPSSMTANPAGLGFYRRSEVTFTPGFQVGKTASRFLSTRSNESNDQFFVGNASLVIANGNSGFSRSKWKGTTMGVSFNRQQTFNRSYGFAGDRTDKRFIDHIVASANTFSDEELDAGFYEDPNTGEIYLDYLEGVYFHLYAFDPENDQPNAAFVPAERTSPVAPSGYVDNSGNHSQWTFSYAANYDDKLYLGGSLGFNKVTNSINRVLDERYVSGQVFRSTRYEEWADMTGNGFNLTLGAIYRVTPDVQIGLSMATPTFMRLRRSLYERASVEPITPDDLPTVGRTHPWDFDYTQIGPFKASLGGTYFLPNQWGFVTGSLDFVGYKGMSIRHSRERDGAWNNLDDWYRNVVNPKIGAEVRLQAFRVRAGLAYFMDPYDGKLIDIVEDRISYSGGLGYRGKRFFVDLSMLYGTQRGAYQLFSTSDTGTLTINDVSGILTVGVNF